MAVSESFRKTFDGAVIVESPPSGGQPLVSALLPTFLPAAIAGLAGHENIPLTTLFAYDAPWISPEGSLLNGRKVSG
jgi:hypothetical protein